MCDLFCWRLKYLLSSRKIENNREDIKSKDMTIKLLEYKQVILLKFHQRNRENRNFKYEEKYLIFI